MPNVLGHFNEKLLGFLWLRERVNGGPSRRRGSSQVYKIVSFKNKITMEKDPLRWKWELSVKALHADQQR